MINNPAPGVDLFVPSGTGTQVYDAASPTGTYTDVDLSSIVGANKAIAGLKFGATGADSRAYWARKNGDTDNHTLSQISACGVCALDCNPNIVGILIVSTDDNGVIEIIGEAPAQNVTIDVSWYIKAA